MKKFILPVALFIFGAGAAFATNTAKTSEETIVKGYRITDNPMEPCEITNKDCSTVVTPNICKLSGETLYELNGTSCEDHLFEP